MQGLERLSAHAGTAPILAALEQDGACIIEDAVSAEHLSGLNRDLEVQIVATTPEMRTLAPKHLVARHDWNGIEALAHGAAKLGDPS